jgi:hypothetical protein
MRKTLRVIGYICLSLFSVDFIISVIDWLARWDWMEAFVGTHPRIGAFLRTPFSSMTMAVFGFVALWAERHLKAPNLIARYANFRAIPDLHTTTMRVFFDTQNQVPGWDKVRIDWDWFVEVQFANASETPCTIDGLKVEISLGTWKDKQIFRSEYVEDLDDFDIDMSLDRQGNGHGQRYVGERYRSIPRLMGEIRNKPLLQEIGYRGWLHFKVHQVNQREMDSGKIRIDLWLIDAMQRKHELRFTKKDERNWDKNFYIGPAAKTLR